ncbi:transposase IS3/IS911 [Cupriavidus sp. GA3-3]|nr:transposase IS3/IS911 [Cupriavidus sp. GA3-3]
MLSSRIGGHSAHQYVPIRFRFQQPAWAAASATITLHEPDVSQGWWSGPLNLRTQDALKQVRELQRLLGKKTMENEILREAVEVMKSRKWIARSPSLPGDDL